MDLVERLISYKALDAELLNRDNENFRKYVNVFITSYICCIMKVLLLFP